MSELKLEKQPNAVYTPMEREKLSDIEKALLVAMMETPEYLKFKEFVDKNMADCLIVPTNLGLSK